MTQSVYLYITFMQSLEGMKMSYTSEMTMIYIFCFNNANTSAFWNSCFIMTKVDEIMTR